MGTHEHQGEIPLAPEDQARMHRLADDVRRQLLEMAETVARVLKFPAEGALEVSRIEIVTENTAEGRRCNCFNIDGECGCYCDPPGICMVCP